MPQYDPIRYANTNYHAYSTAPDFVRYPKVSKNNMTIFVWNNTTQPAHQNNHGLQDQYRLTKIYQYKARIQRGPFWNESTPKRHKEYSLGHPHNRYISGEHNKLAHRVGPIIGHIPRPKFTRYMQVLGQAYLGTDRQRRLGHGRYTGTLSRNPRKSATRSQFWFFGTGSDPEKSKLDSYYW